LSTAQTAQHPELIQKTFDLKYLLGLLVFLIIPPSKLHTAMLTSACITRLGENRPDRE
jgi:hypothetical protein